MLVRLGSRGSRLALTQAELAADALRAARPELEIALVPITTTGDRDRTRPFGEIGARGVFVKEIEEALLAGRVDVAVHSAKDMTSTRHRRASPSARTCRGRTRATRCAAPSELRPGMRIGTASARRQAQLLALEPALSIEPLRGNVDTRLRKRASADSTRSCSRPPASTGSGSGGEIGHRFDPDELAAGGGPGRRGASGARGRGGARRGADDPETRRRVEAERACVARIGGGCLAPVAAYHDGEALTALVAAEDGSWLERRRGDDPVRARRRAARRDSEARVKVVRHASSRGASSAAGRAARATPGSRSSSAR